MFFYIYQFEAKVKIAAWAVSLELRHFNFGHGIDTDQFPKHVFDVLCDDTELSSWIDGRIATAFDPEWSGPNRDAHLLPIRYDARVKLASLRQLHPASREDVHLGAQDGSSRLRMFISWIVMLMAAQVAVQDELPAWGLPFMEASPQEVVASADAFAESEDAGGVTHLYRESSIDLHPDGRKTLRERQIYRIDDRSGLDYWASLEALWRPWYQERPVLRARICQPDGKVNILEEKDIVEGTPPGVELNVYSDERMIKAPLPAVSVGSIVEAEITIDEHAPFFAAGDVHEFMLFDARQATQTVSIRAPKKLPVKVKWHGVETDEETHQTSDGIQITTMTVRGWHADDEPMPMAWCVFEKKGVLGISTGASWRKIAKAYHRLVEDTLSQHDFSADIEGLDPKQPKQFAIQCTHRLKSRVRYTGLYLGQTAIVPTSPDTVLKRGFGDCKDQATVLVGMLRAGGFDAHLALVKAAIFDEVDPDLPGLGAFNHAIVVVEGDTPLWIDPTMEYARQELLPYYLRSCHALIIKPGSDGLVQIPPCNPDDHWATWDLDIELKNQGKGDMVFRTSAGGNQEAELRQRHAETVLNDATRDELREHFQADAVEDLQWVPVDDLSQPWTKTCALRGVGYLASDGQEAAAPVLLSWIIEELPYPLLWEDDDMDPCDIVIRDPKVVRLKERIRAPEHFEPVDLPQDWHYEHALFSAQLRVTHEPEVEIEAWMRLEPGTLTESQSEEIRDWISDLVDMPPMIVFRHSAQVLLEEGETEKAFAMLRDIIQDEPQSAVHHTHLARAFLNMGLVDAAQGEARKATELEPENPDAWYWYGLFSVHDALGRELKGLFDRKTGIEAFEKAVALAPERPEFHIALGMTLDAQLFGFATTDRAILDVAASHYRAIEDFSEYETVPYHLALNRFLAGDFDAIRGLKDELGNDVYNVYDLAITALMRDAAAAIRKSRRLQDKEMRQNALLQASDLASRVRNYSPAGELLAAVRDSQRQKLIDMRSEMLQRAQPIDVVALPPADPTTPAKQLLAWELSLFSPTKQALATVCTEAFQKHLTEVLDPYRVLAKMFASNSDFAGINGPTVVDVVLSNLTFDVIEKNAGYVLDIQGIKPFEHLSCPLFLVKSHDRFKIAACLTHEASVAAAMLEELLDGRKKMARLLAESYAKHRKKGFLENSVTASDDEFKVNLDTLLERFPDDSAADLWVLWSYLASPNDSHAKAVKHLEKLVKTDLDNPVLKRWMLSCLADGYDSLDNVQEANRVFDIIMHDEDATQSQKLDYLVFLATHDRREEGQALADEFLDTWDGDKTRLLMLKSNMQASAEDYDGAIETLKECQDNLAYNLLGMGNELAWLYLFTDRELDEAVTEAEKASTQKAFGASSHRAASLHTLACLYAHQGRLREAIDALEASMRLDGDDVPGDEDWYVFGVITEKLGFQAHAQAYYRRVKPDPQPFAAPVSTYRLAQMRLAALDNPESQKADPAP